MSFPSSSRLVSLAGLFGLLALPVAASSLWTAPGSREQGLVADVKASRVGDILTIVIAETAAQTSSQSKSTNTKSSVDASVNQFLFPSSASRFGTHNGALPGVNFGGGSTYSGGGQVSNSQSLTARAAVMVTDVLPNGNLVISGARRVTFSGETQHVILRGIVRASDISSANTILSSNIADAHLEFISEGALSDAQKRGWISRLYEFLRPF
jgi:flagellar L-ring protein FlgH